jgi:hypothetical protein
MDSRRKEVPMSTATPLQVPLRSPGKYDHLVRPDGLVHRSIYTDPEIFKEEMTKVFGGIWVFLCHEAELPKPYDFKLITVGRRPTIVTRCRGENRGSSEPMLAPGQSGVPHGTRQCQEVFMPISWLDLREHRRTGGCLLS